MKIFLLIVVLLSSNYCFSATHLCDGGASGKTAVTVEGGDFTLPVYPERDLRDTEHRYSEKVLRHLETLAEHGRDTYGSVRTPLFMNVVCADTLTAPSDDNYAPIDRAPPDRRAVGGVDLWWQADLMRVIYRMGEYNPDLTAAADEHITYFMDNLSIFDRHGQDNMLWWGNHLFYDAFKDEPVVPSKEEYEINANWMDELAMWDRMWKLRPSRTLHEVEQIWQWGIFDKDTGKWDRHVKNKERWAVGFSQAGASYMRSFIFAYDKTGQEDWKDRAELLRDHMWNRRNPDTNLIPNAANTCSQRGDDFWRRHFSSSIEPGFWVPTLLYGYQVFGDIEWLDQAEAIMQGYLNHAYDPDAGQFYRYIRLDGVYDPDYSWDEGEAENHHGEGVEGGHSSFWRDTYNFRVNSYIGLAALDVHEITGEQFFLDWGKWFGDMLIDTEPRSDAGTGGGAVGGWGRHYGAAINILMRLHRFTGRRQYLDRAIFMAEEAVTFLWNGQTEIFRGHSLLGYETAAGTDMLTDALVDLDQYLARDTVEHWEDDFREDTILTGRWLRRKDERASAWVYTLGEGKLVLRDESTDGRVSLSRKFAPVDRGETLLVKFSLNLKNPQKRSLVVELNDADRRTALRIGIGTKDDNLQWKYDNGAIGWTGEDSAGEQTYKFEISIKQNKADIFINGSEAGSEIILNNDLTYTDLCRIVLSTSSQVASYAEFDYIHISEQE